MRFAPLGPEEIALLTVENEKDLESDDPVVRHTALGMVRLLESHEHYRKLAEDALADG